MQSKGILHTGPFSLGAITASCLAVANSLIYNCIMQWQLLSFLTCKHLEYIFDCWKYTRSIMHYHKGTLHFEKKGHLNA